MARNALVVNVIFLIHWLKVKLVVVKKILAAFHASTTSF